MKNMPDKNTFDELKEYVEREILPRYAAFDKAHRADHARRVMERSLALAAAYGADERMAYAIAAYHDLGLCEGRETHHTASARILAADERLRRWFSAEELRVMGEAVEDHRASAAHEPRSLYGRIVAEADRLIDPDLTLRRTVQYGLTHYPELDREGHYKRFEKHLADKYAQGGYLKLWLPESDNASALRALREVMADQPRLRAVFDRLFEEETRRA